MQFLDAFKLAESGDKKMKAILARYDKLIDARCEKEHWADLVRAEVVRIFPSSGYNVANLQ
jgi:hypothetical protein